MSELSNVEIEVHLDDSGVVDSMAEDVRAGLTAETKSLPSKYFYDEHGSQLFERITELPEYYLTRAEQSLLDRWADRIMDLTEAQELVELGAGSAKKTRVLIESGLARKLRRYVPVEVSLEMAEEVAHDLGESYPALEVHAVVGDFEAHLGRVPGGRRRVVAFLGSTIGNFGRDEAAPFLRSILKLLGPDDFLLLGTDLVKERRLLEAAYNDGQGVTAAFNKNILSVLNQQLGAEFDLARFDHVSFFNEEDARIESYLRSRVEQTVRIGGLDLEIDFTEGELLATEVSCKYTEQSVRSMLAAAGLELMHWLTDESEAYALSLSRPSS